MRTVVSIPDSLFEAAEKAARRVGISRSELYQRAIARYLQEARAEVVGKRLDAVYANADNRGLDPLIEAASQNILPDENW